MATNNKTKVSSKKAEVVEEKEVVKEAKRKIIPKEVDINQYMTVINGYQGTLVYKSKKTGEIFIWEDFGAEQEMELKELKNAKNSSKEFFTQNLFMFDEENDWVIDYLGLRQFYKNAIDINNFDDVFELKAPELAKVIKGLSDGQKRAVTYRATQLIAEKKIDSLSVISTLEDLLGVELIEK